MAGGAGAASEGFGRASSCWDWAGKKWKKNKFPGKRKKSNQESYCLSFFFFFFPWVFY